MKRIKHFIKGIAIGGTMMVPGLSGGTMALILGIYDEIIHSISSFFKNVKNNFIFLLVIGLGGVIGLVTVGLVVSEAIKHFKYPTMFLFLGIVLGGLPVLFKEADKGKKNKKDWIFLILGVLVIALLMYFDSVVNQSLIDLNSVSKGLYIYLFIAGIVISIALILPGISTSFLLLTLGLLEPTIDAVKTLNLGFIIPLVLGVLFGVIVTTKLLEKLLNKKPRQTYFIIIGFVIASMVEVFPGIPFGLDLILSPILLILGYFMIRYVSKKYSN